MIQRATRSAADSQAKRDDSAALEQHPSYADECSAGLLVKHIYSVMLTSAHVDVADAQVMYAPPKKVVFISRDQMRWIDANRWCR